MKIDDIDVYCIEPEILPEVPDYPPFLSALHQRVVFKVSLDNGIVGYGEYRCYAPDKSVVEPLIGRNPFDFINHDLNIGLSQWCLGLSAALYDAMGKYLEIPAYKLMGTKVRDRVAVSAWTRPSPPDVLSREVQRAVDQGYMLFKMHTCHHYDVFEQNEAVEQTAPDRFRIQYDFNHNRSLGVVLPILKRLEKSWVVGCVEDPLVLSDIDGWRRLREKTDLPLYMHVPPLGGMQEMLHGARRWLYHWRVLRRFRRRPASRLCLLKGEHSLGYSTHGRNFGHRFCPALGSGPAKGRPYHHARRQLRRGSGGDAHSRHRRLLSCTGRAGLGVDVREEELERLANRPPRETPRVLGVTTLPGGGTLYSVGFPNLESLMGYQEGTIRGHRFELRQDDDSEEFARLYERAQREGSILEAG